MDRTPEADETSLPRVGTLEEWRDARIRLLDEEKELTRRRDAVNAARRNLPLLEVTTPYEFTAVDGARRSLLDLFEGRKQLIVYHFMFGPDWDEGCPSCSYTADNIGHLSHLHARNTTLAMVSRAPADTIAAYRERMGWTVPWYSSYDSAFNYDFHVTLDPDITPVEYNFRSLDELIEQEGHRWSEPAGEMPGISAYVRDGDRIYLTTVSYARGIDLVVGTNNWLDLTVLGRQEDWEQPAGRSDGPFMHWLRRHDQYE